MAFDETTAINFEQFERVAGYYLHEAFRYAHQIASYEVAGLLFGERIMAIDPPDGWKPPDMGEGSSLAEWLQNRHARTSGEDPVISAMSEAWEGALRDADSSGRKLPRTHRVTSTDLLGHAVTLAACVESVMNRQLYALAASGKLDDQLSRALDRIDVVPKVLFALKEEALAGKLDLGRLKFLFRLRNQAVHFRADGPELASATVEDLLGVWRAVAGLFALVPGEPTEHDVEFYVSSFRARWVE